MTGFMIETPRLILRSWHQSDCKAFFELAKDPEVMRYLPALDRSKSDAIVARMIARQQDDGHCFWALETRDSGQFLGFCGLGTAPEQIGGVEVGWRLRRSAWGQGLASEAARASLAWGWQNLDLSEIISFTHPENLRSRAVMERIGMTRVEDGDFDHPSLPDGDPLRRCVLYRIGRP